jgi:hypothetical protein
MVDALNVHISNDAEGDAGVLKNAWGNEAVAFETGSELVTGSGIKNVVVGSTVAKEKSELIFFVYNSTGAHSIYYYTTLTNKAKLIYRDSVLGFTEDAFVKADCIVKENGDTLLYFTDGNTDPKKINVTKALSGSGYPYKSVGAYNYTDDEKILSIAALKQPPLAPPTVAFATVANQDNFVYDEFFQFAYQYVYEDGEVSALSPYSEIGISVYQLLDGFVTESAKNIFNAINVTVKHSKGDVSKIRLLAKSASISGFFVAEEINNNRALTSETITFTNSKLRSYISALEQNKMYDNVPQKANTQAIAGNRLLYGGYTEFYDNVDTSVSISEINNADGQSVYLSVNPTSASTVYYNPSGSVVTSKFGFVVGDTVNSTSYDSSVILDFQVYGDISVLPGTAGTIDLTDVEATNDLNLGPIYIDIAKQFNLPAYSDLTSGSPDVYSYFVNNIIGDYPITITDAWADLPSSSTTHNFKGTAVVNISLDSINYGSTQISFLVKVKSVSLETVSATETFTGVPVDSTQYISFSLDPTLLNTTYSTQFVGFRAYKNYNSRQYYVSANTTFKAGQEHKFGIVYYDAFNRSGAVNEIGSKEVTWYSERASGERGPVSMQFRVKHNPPSWAKKWQLVYAPFSSYNYCLQYSVAEAFALSTDDIIYVSMSTLEGKPYSYIDFKDSNVQYVFGDGDKVRIIKYETGTLPGGVNNYVSHEFDVVGYEYYSTSDTPIGGIAGLSDDRKTGWFLKLKNNLDAIGFTKAEVIADTDLWNKNTVIEIYRPIKQSDVNIYREISEVYDVVNASGSYKHKGARDYSYTWTSSLTNISISGGVATTSLDIRSGDALVISATILGVLTSYEVRVDKIKRVGSNLSFSVTNANEVGGISTVTPPDGSYYLASIDNLNEAVIETFNGDAYYRLRQMNVVTVYSSTPLMTTTYENMFVEDNSISDFKDSNFISVGRPNAPAPTAGRIYRKSTITYSEPYVLDSQVLSLSSFNLGQANFIDLASVYGSIQYVVDNGDSIIILQERKASIAPINRNLIEYISGGAGVTVSTNFIGTQSFYAGDYGVGTNPESVVTFLGRTFYADIRSGKVIRIGGDGLDVVSEHGMDSYTKEKFSKAVQLGESNFKLVGSLDPRHDEYILSIQKRFGSGSFEDDTIALEIGSNLWSTRYSYMPESSAHIDNILFTFKDGVMWKHSNDAARNTFYGVNGGSIIKVVSSQNNSMVKVYEAISVEGNSPWSFSAETREQSTVTIDSMDKREGMYYSSVPTATVSTSNITPLGKVKTVTSATGGFYIEFFNDVYNMPFSLGSSVKIASGGLFNSTDLSISSIVDRNKIFVSGTSTITANSLIAAVSNSQVDGDKIRGPYAVFTFTSNLTTPTETYAFNAYFNRSMLHNELVN